MLLTTLYSFYGPPVLSWQENIPSSVAQRINPLTVCLYPYLAGSHVYTSSSITAGSSGSYMHCSTSSSFSRQTPLGQSHGLHPPQHHQQHTRTEAHDHSNQARQESRVGTRGHAQPTHTAPAATSPDDRAQMPSWSQIQHCRGEARQGPKHQAVPAAAALRQPCVRHGDSAEQRLPTSLHGMANHFHSQRRAAEEKAPTSPAAEPARYAPTHRHGYPLMSHQGTRDSMRCHTSSPQLRQP